MSRGTYLTHRIDPKGLALSLADVTRLSLLDHVGKFIPKAFKVGRGRIRGLALPYCTARPDPDFHSRLSNQSRFFSHISQARIAP
jgi:hypothetical protein